MRNVSIAAICLSMFAAGWLTRDQPSTTQASTKAEPVVSASIPEIDIPEITSDPIVETQFITTSGSDCANGSCSIVQPASNGRRVTFFKRSGNSQASEVKRWTTLKNVASRWQSRSASGRWYPGKNLGRLFGRR